MHRRRPDLRIIIASATIQADDFKRFFDTRHLDTPKPAPAGGGGGSSSAAGAGAGAAGPSREPGVISVEGRAHSVGGCTS
jgi:ATP-dependent RNA helicase DDX35